MRSRFKTYKKIIGRAHIIGPYGHVESRVDLDCADEAEAIGLAKQLVDGQDVELWYLDRKIQTFRHSAGPGKRTLGRAIDLRFRLQPELQVAASGPAL